MTAQMEDDIAASVNASEITTALLALAGAKDADGAYIFNNEVRVACLGIHVYATGHPESLPCCAGRGWTAATEGWVWWSAAKRARIPITLELRLVEEHGDTAALTFVGGNRIDDQDPEAAFFAALLRVVAAIEGVEVPDGN